MATIRLKPRDILQHLQFAVANICFSKTQAFSTDEICQDLATMNVIIPKHKVSQIINILYEADGIQRAGDIGETDLWISNRKPVEM